MENWINKILNFSLASIEEQDLFVSSTQVICFNSGSLKLTSDMSQ